MVQIIAGRKGKGKTKYLLEKANTAIKDAHGSIVYLDKNSQHMHELNRRIRLIDMSEYPIHSYEAFLGFICGLISQDYDLEQVYLDGFLTLSNLNGDEIEKAIDELEKICKKYKITFTLSVSEDKENLPPNAQERTIIAL
ncbi:twitching motility protein PilT [Cuneatibacter sp. NSJ-177]|uniref:twitching motility protein PilT n=1 Tax=Cuneatibacter sp. NSJ-177 TaxID=2931401 RepID=UPI001FD5715E|nr:twitching motility protein PilT [Cuneatibacter sp. NSJ-177]MCJ7836442.1 twitching motility protein PilT [Cuneatibacter sp. NSJ-177]